MKLYLNYMLEELQDLEIEKTKNLEATWDLEYTNTYYKDLRKINERFIHLINGLPSFITKFNSVLTPLGISVEEHKLGFLKYIRIK